jgi:hypothetical protein
VTANMKEEYSQYPFHPETEALVATVCKMVQNNNPMFFHLLVNYHLTKMASMMRVKVNTLDRGLIPVNMFAINLAPSGMGLK